MAFLLFYPSDAFKGGLPDEVSYRAFGGSRQRLKLEDDAEPVRIEIRDDEECFEEGDASQVLAQDVVINDVLYEAGTPVNTAYDLIHTGSDLKVTALHFGGDGSEQGMVQGLVTTEVLEPGEKYKFNVNRSSWRQDNHYEDYVACFVEGTRIETSMGWVPVEALNVGDLVETFDAGTRPITWIGSREVAAVGAFAPIEFARGILENERALRLSPQHRVLRCDPCLSLLFGVDEALVAAKHLVDDDAVRRLEGGQVRYWHFMLQDHQIVRAEGMATETMMASDMTLHGFEMEARQELVALFPELFAQSCEPMKPARPCLKMHEARLLPKLQRARRGKMATWQAAA